MAHSGDLDLTKKDISGLASVDAIAAFLAKLGYDTSKRNVLTPQAIGLTEDVASATKKIEMLSADADDFLRVVFVQLKSLTAKSRNGFVAALKKSNIDHLLICVSNFDTLEFVLLDKSTKKRSGASGQAGIEVIARIVAVDRKDPSRLELRTLRRLTWTCRDSLDQYDKLRSVFQAAAYTEEHFQNRALFADHYLMERLKDDPLWQDNPSEMFAGVKELLKDAARRWRGKGEKAVRDELYEPLFEQLGFKLEQIKEAHDDNPHPDYILKGQNGTPLTAAFVYEWDRWLDGPDFNDQNTPEENPGACVISTLESGDYGWVVVTNGRLWRLYSRQAHSRATNFYEVDLTEALIASGDTDPNEAFRYWWLFFRSEAFAPIEAVGEVGCWLDLIVRGSRDYAKRLGERLKGRIFVTIFPHLAMGFLEDRKQRLGHKKTPSNEELKEIFEATLTLLYRLLFLLYAESRDLLPIREAPYRDASLKKIKEEIAGKAGGAKSDAEALLKKAYLGKETKLYDRLTRLFQVMDKGDASLNVPTYNGGLFITSPEESDNREHRIARFLAEHKVPDRRLAMAIDLLARDQDEKTLGLVFIDYKSLDVRHLGSIYEGLLEFKLKIAEEDLTTKTEKKKEKFIPLAKAKPKRGKTAETVVRKGEVYLSNDKAERKATGSYYTPDPIVKYIVEHTVGPVLEEKLEALRTDFRKVRTTYDRHLQNAKTHPLTAPTSEDKEPRQFAAKKTYVEHKDLVDRFFDMKVLDPAMGSGHFLVEAVDFITDRLLSFLNQFPINPISFTLEQTRRNILQALDEQQVAVDSTKLTDVNLLKRHVLKRSVYGVDLNPMAVELAKVSLWLDAFTLGAPLSFLDHHLHVGNSLIGELRISEHVFSGSQREEELCRTVNNMMSISSTADANPSDVRLSKSLYDEVETLATPFKNRLNIETATHFHEFDSHTKRSMIKYPFDTTFDQNEVPELLATSYATYADILTTARERRFFHWEIEFPEVFFGFGDVDKRRVKHKSDITDGTAGFDAVVGNPPYDVLKRQKDNAAHNQLVSHYRSVEAFTPAMGRVLNIYRLFVVNAWSLLRGAGRLGFIIPMTILSDVSAAGTRRLLLEKALIGPVEAFPQKDDPNQRVFPEAKLSTLILCATPSSPNSHFELRVHPGNRILDESLIVRIAMERIESFDPQHFAVPIGLPNDMEIIAALMDNPSVQPAGNFADVLVGEIDMTNDRDVVVSRRGRHELLKGAHIQPYLLRKNPKQGRSEWVEVAKYRKKYRGSPKESAYTVGRIIFQGITGTDDSRRIKASMSEHGHFLANSINYLHPKQEQLSQWFLLGWLNSSIVEWRFRLTSTNNNVNNYEIEAIPFPVLPQERMTRPTLETISPITEIVVGSLPPRTAWEWGSALDDPWVLHDQVAALAKRMSEHALAFQVERDTFVRSLEESLDLPSGARISTFKGKTTIMEFVPDYRAEGSSQSWENLEKVLKKNLGKNSRTVLSLGNIGRMKSLMRDAQEKCNSHRIALCRAEHCIDLILGAMYGVKDDEIRWIRSSCQPISTKESE